MAKFYTYADGSDVRMVFEVDGDVDELVSFGEIKCEYCPFNKYGDCGGYGSLCVNMMCPKLDK